ncbi:hypothetical protein [Photobacterium sanctipauli]|uniref:hypothetical protein n=1 Tax=Photobacterium sanctipauli TaxID=1342794 RepID=UPI00068BC1FB|nr:hypothetical protein [Photobacterium sanctipauli]
MKKTIFVLAFGVLLQFVALYVAFYSGVEGNLYLATLISVAAMGCLVVIRSLIAPVCLAAGILIGLSLSHNDADLEMLGVLEDQAIAALNLNQATTNTATVSEPILTASAE